MKLGKHQSSSFAMTFIFVVASILSYAQTPQFDSLVKANQRYLKEDNIKLNMLNEIADGYRYLDPAKGIQTAEFAMTLALKLKNQKGYATALNNKAANLLVKGNTKEADSILKQVLIFNEKINNEQGIADNYNTLGRAAYLKGDYNKQLELYQKALSLNEKLSNKSSLAESLRGIGIAYSYKEDQVKALEYYNRALQIAESIHNKNITAAILGNIGIVYYKLADYPKALEYYQKALSINNQLGNNANIGLNLYNIGLIYKNLSDYPKALEYYQKVIDIDEQMGNKNGLARDFNAMGYLYQNYLSDYPKALEYNQRALIINEQLENKNGIAFNLLGIGNIYFRLSDYLKALEYYQKALRINEQLENKSGMASNLGNIGGVYYNLSEYPKALEYYQKALSINQQIEDKSGIALNFDEIGGVYYNLYDYSKALEYYQKALGINEQMGNKNGIAWDFKGFGNFYFSAPDSVLLKIGVGPAEKYVKALEYYNLSLQVAKEIGDLFLQKTIWENLSKTYEKQKDFAKSYEAYKNYISIRDSIVGNDKQKEISRLQMQFDYDKKEAAYKYEKELSDEKLLRQEKELGLKQQALTLGDKEKELQRLLYLKQQADLEKEKSQSREKEKDFALTQKLKQNEISYLQSQNEVDKLNASKRIGQLFGMGGALSGVIFVALAFYSQNKKKQKLNAELSIANHELENAYSDLKSTQSQLVQQEKMASLGALTAGIAHEIKTPLNFVNNFAELSADLIDEFETTKDETERKEILQTLKQNLEKINRHGKRADGIVKSMLEHSRTSSGEKLPADINQLCEEALNLSYHGMRANIPDFNCEIKKDFEPGLAKIKVVSQEMSRVLLNLFNNAFYAVNAKKEMRGYEPIVSIATIKKLNNIVIKVWDNGSGIPGKTVQKIFEPFFTTKPTGEGTGLGLSLSYDIIKAHGGEIKVESKENEFTEFVISLPL